MGEISGLKNKIEKVRTDLNRSKEELRKARLEAAMPRSKTRGPKFNKDTKVNLDMSMWITHNVTKEEQEQSYQPLLKYGEEPQPQYEQPKYEEPKYEEPKYEEPENEKPKEKYNFKYEEPEEKYDEPEEKYEKAEEKYDEPEKYEPVVKYEEQKY